MQDPTQNNRDLLKRLLASVVPKSSPISSSIKDFETAGLPAPEYEMPEELKQHAASIFPALNEIQPKSNIQIPFSPESQPEEEMAIQEQQVSPSRSPASIAPAEIAQPELEESITEPIDNRYLQEEQAIQQSKENERIARIQKQMAKTSDAIMDMGLGKVQQNEYSMYDDKIKDAKAPIENLLLLDQLKLNKDKNDPNSQLSKTVRNTLKTMGLDTAGMDKVSYAQLEKIYPSLTQALYTKMAADSRKIEHAMSAGQKDEARQHQNYFKTASLVNSKVEKLFGSDEYKGFQQTKQADALISQALASWDNQDKETKIDNSAAFINYAKLAQGDDSVVRSEDMKTLAGGLNYSNPQALLNKFAAKTKGAVFSKEELSQMKQVVDTIKKVKKDQIRNRLIPIKTTADQNDYSLDAALPPDFIEEVLAPEPANIQDRAKRLQELRRKQQEE